MHASGRCGAHEGAVPGVAGVRGNPRGNLWESASECSNVLAHNGKASNQS
jgi:hypothetical protein